MKDNDFYRKMFAILLCVITLSSVMLSVVLMTVMYLLYLTGRG